MTTTISENDFLNATLALIRGDVLVARELFRKDGAAMGRQVSVVTTKLYEAMEQLQAKTASDLMIQVLKKTMSLKPAPGTCNEEDYLLGVVAVEQIINDMVIELHRDGLPLPERHPA
jgi:hypothetical protein